MAKSKTKTAIEFQVPTRAIQITDMDAAIDALREMEEISEQIAVAQARTVDLKKEVTEWAVDKKVDVIQLDDHYYRQIQRTNSGWNVDKLKKIVKGLKTKEGKPLWNFITRRVPDPEAINVAVKRGLISESKINKAFEQTPQKPFLQKFLGEAIDG